MPEEKIVTKWRLQPGKMLLIDLEAGLHRLRRRAEAPARHGQPLPPVAGARRRSCWRTCRPSARAPPRTNASLLDRQQAFGYTPGRPEAPDGADGDHRPGGGRLDGHRHAGRRALAEAEAPLQLLQAELRAGDQPGDRPDPRGGGHEPRLVHRAAAEPLRPEGAVGAQAPGSAPADPDQRGPGEDPRDRRHRRQPFPDADARHHLRVERGAAGHGHGADAALRPRRARRARRLQHHHPLRPAGRRRDASQFRRCSPPPPSTTT